MVALWLIRLSKLSEIWARAFILYVVGETPSIGTIMRYIAGEWGQIAKPRVFLHDVEPGLADRDLPILDLVPNCWVDEMDS